MNKNPKLNLNISEGALLSLVADKLKDRVLFPKKLEKAKKINKHLSINSK